jgi:gas vesicle protein
MTAKPTSKMSLTIDDQKWIKILFDRQDEVTEKLIIDTINIRDRELAKALAEVIAAQNNRLFEALENHTCLIQEVQKSLSAINLRLDSIEKRLNSGDIRLAILEKYSSPASTISRIIITLLIGLGLGFLIHSFIK